jgi:hypothetical protein
MRWKYTGSAKETIFRNLKVRKGKDTVIHPCDSVLVKGGRMYLRGIGVRVGLMPEFRWISIRGGSEGTAMA